MLTGRRLLRTGSTSALPETAVSSSGAHCSQILCRVDPSNLPARHASSSSSPLPVPDMSHPGVYEEKYSGVPASSFRRSPEPRDVSLSATFALRTNMAAWIPACAGNDDGCVAVVGTPVPQANSRRSPSVVSHLLRKFGMTNLNLGGREHRG